MSLALLQDKVCLIVGAASLRGIGFATAKLFAEHGAKLVVVDLAMIDAKTSEIRAAIPNVEILGMKCDIQNIKSCEDVITQTISKFDKLDVLVNCAGIVKAQSMLDIAESDYDAIMGVNLKGTFNICKAALKQFKAQGSGSLINLASVAAQRGGGLVGGAHYAASKGGVVSLTRSIAREFGPSGIRANVICPSMIETSMLDGNISEQQFTEITSAIPLKRAGKPRDIAGACLYLASDLSAYVTGTTLDVNGGSHIH